MKKWIVVAGLLLLVLAGVVGWAALNLNRYLDENRTLIETKVSELIGRSVAFDRLSLSFRGGLAVRFESLSISDDPAYSDRPFVTATSALGQVRILPALRGEFDIVRVTLEQPQVTIIRDETGWNVSSIATASQTEEPAADQVSEPESGGAAAIAIALFDIHDGTLRFIDRIAEPDFETQFQNIEFHASDLAAETPVQIELSASVLGASDANLVLAGTVGPIAFDAPDHSPVAMELKLAPIDGEAAVAFGRSFGAPDTLTVRGTISAHARVTGTGADPKLHLKFDATQAVVDNAGTFHKPQDVNMTLTCDASSDGETATLPSWSFQLGDSLFEGTAQVHLDDSGIYRATVRSAPSDFAPLIAMTGAPSDARIDGTFALDLKLDGNSNAGRPNVEGELKLGDAGIAMPDMPTIHDYSTRILISSDTLVLEPAELGIGKSKARFDATIRNFDEPQVTFSFESKALALADVGAASPDAGTSEELRGLTVKGVIKKSGDTESGFGVRSELAVDTGVARGVEFAALKATVRYVGGRATLDPLSLRAYGGRLEGKGRYESRDNAQPEFSFDLRAEDVNAAEIASTGTTGGSPIEGTVDGRLIATGRGEAWETVRTTLDGNGSFSISGGKIRDVNLAEEVLQGITGLPGLSSLLSPELKLRHPGLFSTGDTTFQDLTTNFTMKSGRMFTKDLNLAAADYGIRGDGSMGLDGNLDMNATFQASPALTRSLVSEVSAAKYLAGSSGRLEIPFRLGGTLPAVRAEPDMRVLTKALEGALVGGLIDQLFGKPKPAESGDSTGSQKKRKKKR